MEINILVKISVLGSPKFKKSFLQNGCLYVQTYTALERKLLDWYQFCNKHINWASIDSQEGILTFFLNQPLLAKKSVLNFTHKL